MGMQKDSFPRKNTIHYHQSEQRKHEYCDNSISGCSYLADHWSRRQNMAVKDHYYGDKTKIITDTVKPF